MPILLLSVLSLLHVAAAVGYLQQNLAGLEHRVISAMLKLQE